MFDKIVVGIDGSKTSETALEVACDLAGKHTLGTEIPPMKSLRTLRHVALI